jgi:hypothetical protein
VGDEIVIGPREFYRLTGADAVHVRLMEAARVISPARLPAGRVFTSADVEAGRRWIAANTPRRRVAAG